MSNFLSKKRVNFPRVILDVLLGSMELAIEMVIKITDDFKILSEVKSLRIARLGYIDVRFFSSILLGIKVKKIPDKFSNENHAVCYKYLQVA